MSDLYLHLFRILSFDKWLDFGIVLIILEVPREVFENVGVIGFDCALVAFPSVLGS